jgi:hypothetical protein
MGDVGQCRLFLFANKLAPTEVDKTKSFIDVGGETICESAYKESLKSYID